MKNLLLKLTFAILLASSTLAQDDPETIADFRRKVFRFTNKTPGLYQIDVGISDTPSWLAAFGDIAQTGYTGIVLADNSNQNLSLLTWEKKESSKQFHLQISNFNFSAPPL
jgi:hypothetical protein